jgi:ABC-type lipoprotein release transport system permease subunit
MIDPENSDNELMKIEKALQKIADHQQKQTEYFRNISTVTTIMLLTMVILVILIFARFF